tara:strand:+ start:256 stop:600 length:345 start_codon:yes stop_codon:yes gene_type:complete
MAINYKWDVSTVNVKTVGENEDTVFNVHWRLIATDNVNNDAEGNAQTASVYGTQILDTSDLSNFIAFADLTASDVQGWVKEALGSDKVAELKANLNGNIAELVAPKQQTKTIGE